jgi:hypothetical protein
MFILRRAYIRKSWIDDANQKDLCSLHPSNENLHFYVRKMKDYKGQKLTGVLKGIKI